MSFAVIPVKRLAESKSRLAQALGRERCEALCIAMLRDVVDAARGCAAIERVAVVTPDPDVLAVASEAGAIGLEYREPGLNAAIEFAVQQLGPNEAALTLLGDVAGARSEDLAALFGRARTLGARSVVLAPASDGGSAALLRTPGNVMPARFGAQSADAHRREAAQRGVPFAELTLPSLELDLDDAADLGRFLAARGDAGARTRECLGGFDLDLDLTDAAASAERARGAGQR